MKAKKIPASIRTAAHAVRDGIRSVRKNFSAEYLHTTIEGVVDDLEARYPQGGRGRHKIGIARILLNKVLGREYVDENWLFVGDLITALVALKKA